MAYGAKLSELAEWSADQGTVLSDHHHMGAMVQGADPVAVLDKWEHRVRHVHFKDVRQPVLDWVNAEDKSFLDGVAAGVYSVPGDPEGCIGFQAVTDRLRAMDYSGWIVVEAGSAPATSRTRPRRHPSSNSGSALSISPKSAVAPA